MRQRIEEVMYGRSRPLLLGTLLHLLSLLYGFAMRVRSALYRAGVLAVRKLPCTVVSVGNITMGGTGKTPAVISIANLLRDRGRSPAVVSRGYGRARERDLLMVSDGTRRLEGPATGGDEPVLIAERTPGVPVFVGADRFRSGMMALDQAHPDVIVLDDGYQHMRLARDLNIALIDAGDPFGNGRLFPAGVLREHPRELVRADAVILTRIDASSDPAGLIRSLRAFTPAEIFTAIMAPVALVAPASGETKPLSLLQGAPVAAFAGIARPESFYSTLHGLGADMRDTAAFPDHHAYSADDLRSIRTRADRAGAGLLVTTEKDMVRLEGLEREGIWALRIEQLIREQDAWVRFLAERI